MCQAESQFRSTESANLSNKNKQFISLPLTNTYNCPLNKIELNRGCYVEQQQQLQHGCKFSLSRSIKISTCSMALIALFSLPLLVLVDSTTIVEKRTLDAISIDNHDHHDLIKRSLNGDELANTLKSATKTGSLASKSSRNRALRSPVELAIAKTTSSLASGPVITLDQRPDDLETGANEFEILRVAQTLKPEARLSTVDTKLMDKRLLSSASDELTYRQAAQLPANSSSLESQWIPIRGVNQRTNGRVQVTSAGNSLKPNHNQRHPTRHSQMVTSQTTTSRKRIPTHVNGMAPVESRNHRRLNGNGNRNLQRPMSQMADTSMSYRSFYKPPISHYGANRRPRLNYAPEEFDIRASKMYKKVLLCDKTLVSLDYIRHLDFEGRPYGPSYETPLDDNDNFADNFIDLDSNIEASSVVLAPNNRRSFNTTTTSQDSASASTSTASNDLSTSSSNNLERRSGFGYLSDEDPLVKCDMWDLEKGLKNRKPPENILRMAIKADFDTVRDAINRCRQLSERTLPPEDEYREPHGIEVMSTEDLISLFSMKRGLIPGTKWCGLGDQASNYNDLGPKHRIDICCRAHDHCPIRLKPFRNDYGVLNIALYTKSHCDCDADFYRCLREVRSRTADMLGNLYFNVMKLQCMREERMKVCREMKPIALGFERCVRYEDSPIKTVFKFTTPPVAY